MSSFSMKLFITLILSFSSLIASAECCKPNYGGNCQVSHSTPQQCWDHENGIIVKGSCPLAPNSQVKRVCTCQFEPKIHGVSGTRLYGNGFNISKPSYIVKLVEEIPYAQSCVQNCGSKFIEYSNLTVRNSKEVARANARADGACGGEFIGELKADGKVISTDRRMGYHIGGSYAEIDTDFEKKKYCNGSGFVYEQMTYKVVCQLILKHRNEVLKEVIITSGSPDSCKGLIPLSGVENLYASKLQIGENIFELYYRSTKPRAVLVDTKKYTKSNINGAVNIRKDPSLNSK